MRFEDWKRREEGPLVAVWFHMNGSSNRILGVLSNVGTSILCMDKIEVS